MSENTNDKQRVVIRDNDYYGGSIYVENVPGHEFQLSDLTIVWEAYQGGGARIVIQSAEELETLGKLLLQAAETIDPERIERGEPDG